MERIFWDQERCDERYFSSGEPMFCDIQMRGLLRIDLVNNFSGQDQSLGMLLYIISDTIAKYVRIDE